MSETPETEQNAEAAPLETEPSQTGEVEDGPVEDGPVDGEPSGSDAARSDSSDETGHPAVDAVLASLEGLDELPVGEHPPIFEEAHEALRSALARARDGVPGDQPHKH